MDRSRLLAMGLVSAALVPVAVVVTVGTQPAMLTPRAHFWLVASAAAIACLASLTLSFAGARAGDGRAVLMGTAFSTMTALFMVHGFATPTIFAAYNGMMPLAGGLSVPAGAVILALTALPALRRPRGVRPLVALQVGLFAGVIGFGAFGLLNPTVLPAVPQARSNPATVLVFVGGFCLGLLIIRAVRTYLLTRRGADLTVALGCFWLCITLWANLVIGPMTIAYFLGHALEIVAVALVAIPTALDLRRAGASRALVGDLTSTELVEREEAYLGPRVRALMVRLEGRDVSTEEHTRRVAYLAARVGEELKLSATARRHLAVGGLLHDIGKLAVPLEILNKPGKLTDEEFAAIKRHPGDGRKLLEELGGFPEAVRELVSDHHERLDGSGYPRGLTAMDMSVETRILAVCDVYDALVSDRVYRSAWSPERAFALLQEEAHAYDQTVVTALKQVVSPGFVADLAAAPTPARLPVRAVARSADPA